MKDDSRSVESSARSVRTDPCRIHFALFLSAAAILLWSGIRPSDRFNWFMETLPAMVGGLLLAATYRRFPFTTVTYALVWVFAIVLMIGGHYTYADVPIGNFARDAFGLSRNHFDRVGHFLQGVVPAMLARELLRRTSPLGPGKWLATVSVCVALSVSACYELFEWRYAVAFGGEVAENFLGSQGDPWDAQQDMWMALLGASAAVAFLGRWQDRQAERAGLLGGGVATRGPRR